MSGREDRRDRQSAEKRDKTETNSLEDSSTPVDSRPYKKTDIPEDNIQDSKLYPVQEQVVTAAAVSTTQQNQRGFKWF